MDFNDTDIESLLQVSTDQDTFGFDLSAGKTWVYPTNYPVREYQYNIAQSALYENTLVSLPTGLGKTFIAAVVMYNFYRWYPTGKIIFMAPTKPLVRQQIDACYDIMAIPPEVTSEMTGAKITASRVSVWKDKRVFFITPHILQNDLETIPDLGVKIRCVVIDEAHKALGRQANCEVIRKLREKNTNFRVLALSATPGSNFKNVVEVIANLMISHIESRTEESSDVAPYVFNRKLDTVVVPLGGMLQEIKEQYLKILDRYTRPLINMHVLSGNCAFLTKGKILLTMRDYKENTRNRNNYNQIMCSFTICITLYHGYELLIRHGLRSFLTFFEANIDKPLINSVNNLRSIVEEVRDYLGPTPTVDILPDGTIPDIPDNTMFGHPKFYKLSDILSDHFKNAENASSTRAMVFCEYRESVNEAYVILLKHRPLIRPKIFIGKGMVSGKGQTQAQQLLAVKMFREGKCNTLIATCIGEEGIDVGEVDLIICFDISTKSPVRMVQRMGRTGRKRNGRVVILVTEGREQQTLQECLVQKSCMTNILNSNHISNHFYKNNPRMIPDGLEPSCVKMHITVPKKNEKTTKKKTGKNTIRNMFENISQASSKALSTENEIDDIDAVPEFDRLPKPFEFWNRTKSKLFESSENKNRLYAKKLEKQTILTETVQFGHSSTTEAFVSLLKFADKKKYNLPTTQLKMSQRSKDELLTASQVNNFVQVDIRNMFKPRIPKTIIEIDDQDDIQPPLYDFISAVNNYVKYDNVSDVCEICSNFFLCSTICQRKPIKTIDPISLPDYSAIDNINEESLTLFMKTLNENNTCMDIDTTNDSIESKLSKTLEFFKITDIEDIFGDDETESTNPKTPSNETVDKINESPVLFGRMNNLQIKVKQQLSQTKTCRKSFRFENENSNLNVSSENTNVSGEKLNVSDENIGLNDSAEMDLFFDQNEVSQNSIKNINDDNSEDMFSDDIENYEIPNEFSKLNNISSTKQKMNNEKSYESAKDDTDLDNNEEIDLFQYDIEPFPLSDEEIPNKCMENENSFEKHHKNNMENHKSTSNVKKSNKFFEETTDKLKNIENMFDVGDISLFGSDNSNESQNKSPKIITTTVENICENEIDNSIIYSPILDKPDQDESISYSPIVNKSIIEKNTFSQNGSRRTILNISNCSSSKSQDINIDINKHVPFKSPILSNVNSKNSSEKIKSDYFDPDETILLSSDEENNFILSPKYLKTPIKSTVLIKSPNLNNLNKSPNLINSTNKNNSTLLSVTQMISFINDKDLESSLKENETNTSQSFEKQFTPGFINEQKRILENIHKQSTPIVQKKNIFDNIPKESTPKEHNNKNKFFEDDLSDFDLTFTTNTPVKKFPTEKLKIKSLKTQTNDTFSKLDWSEIEPAPSPEKTTKVNENVDWLDEDSLLKFSYTSPWKNNSNEKINNNKKDETTTDDSPLKVKKVVKKIALSDSDDDFDLKIVGEQEKKVKKNNPTTTNTNKNSTEFKKPNKGLLKLKTHPKVQNPFIDHEAEIEEDDDYESDSGSNSEDMDAFESSFIGDTQLSQSGDVDMHAKYLQSIKSPVLNRGGFKIPKPRPRYTNVFSQTQDLDEDNTYMQDSFCVDSESTMKYNDDMSYLERAEAEIERQRKKKRKRSETTPKKRKRLIQYFSDSD